VQTILHCKKLLKSSAVRQHVQRLNRKGVFKFTITLMSKPAVSFYFWRIR
jgi:hypothetical protein